MDDDLLLFSLTGKPHLDRSILRRMLHVHIACGEARAVREWLLRALIVIGLPVWAAALQPGRVPTSLRTVSADLWAAGAVAFVMALIVEWWCRRLRRRFLAQISSTIA
jgi:hypothetical protein